jgi:hypothetical protein
VVLRQIQKKEVRRMEGTLSTKKKGFAKKKKPE